MNECRTVIINDRKIAVVNNSKRPIAEHLTDHSVEMEPKSFYLNEFVEIDEKMVNEILNRRRK